MPTATDPGAAAGAMGGISRAEYDALHRFARTDLRTFVQLAWPELNPGTPMVWSWHLDAICDHLEAVTNGDIRRLIINVPPGSSKTSIVCQTWPVWEWLRAPERRWGFAAYGSDLSTRDSVYRRRLISSDWFQQQMRPDWQLAGDQSVKMSFDNDAGGGMRATSVGGPGTGFHFDRLVTDDPIKPVDIYTARLGDHVRWFRETWQSRMRDPMRAAQIIIMQRLHDVDLAGVLLKAMKHGGERWEHLCIPMRYDPAIKSTTSIGWRDPRKADGELLCPTRWPTSWVDAKERSDPRTFSAQYQQTPKVADGTIFKEGSFRFYHLDEHIDGCVPYPGDAAMTRWVGSWDFTFEAGKGTDYNCGGVWARHGADIYLRDLVHRRMEFSVQRQAALALARKWPEVRCWLIEKKANGAAILDTLRRPYIDATGERDNGLVGLVPVNPTEGKIARAHAVSAIVEGGHMVLPHPSIAPWVTRYIDELVSFPTGAHDDMVDMTTQALRRIGSNGVADDDDALEQIAPGPRPRVDPSHDMPIAQPGRGEVDAVKRQKSDEQRADAILSMREAERLAARLGIQLDPMAGLHTRTFGQER